METIRWLLPFTFEVDMRAIAATVCLAANAGVTLVPVSFISALPEKGARLEYIQQSKDFLEAVQQKTGRYHVPVERYEVFTADVSHSIRTLVHEMRCDGIILVTGGERTCLMQSEEVKRLLIEPPTALVLIRLPEQNATRFIAITDAGSRLFSWLRRRLPHPNPIAPEQSAPPVEEPLWIRTEQRYMR